MPVIILTLLIVGIVTVGIVGLVKLCIENMKYPVEYSEIVEKVADSEGVPEYVIYSVIYTESSFDKDAVSSAKAVGLMQLLPSTAEWLCGRDGVEYDEAMLTDPEFNIKYGTRYLRILYDRYENWDAAHAAYHAGFTRVDNWLSDGSVYYNEYGQLVGIPIESTEVYVNKLRTVREKYFKQLEKEKEE